MSILKSFDLTGKLALDTGASRGIGRGIAEALAGAGANILGVSASLSSSGSEVETSVKKIGRDFKGYKVDFSKRDELLNFVSACLGISPIYRWADPLACHAYNVMKPEGILPWHFDSCEFTLSFMIQKPEKGGIFEYCPNIREPGNEKLEEVKKVLDGDRKRVRQLKLEPGDLQIFKGRFTLHRVTKIEGNRSRYLCIPAYVLDPWRVNTPEHSKAIYGKVLPIHIERNKPRSDGLAD